jgi:hypothetical protein
MDGERVAVVSEAMARRFWPNADPVGRRFRLGDATGPEVTVVGVVATARFRDLTTDLAAPAAEPDVFFPLSQRTDTDLEVAVRSRTGALPDAALLRRAVEEVAAGIPVFDVQPLREAMRQQSAVGRFGSVVLTAFGALALLLAAIGIYGVVAFAVGASRREIAIRMALGAPARRVLGLIVRNGMALVGAGIALGLGASLWLTGLLRAQLYGVSATDPLTLGAVAAAVLLVALLASWLPARRAARVDPQVALRTE